MGKGEREREAERNRERQRGTHTETEKDRETKRDTSNIGPLTAAINLFLLLSLVKSFNKRKL